MRDLTIIGAGPAGLSAAFWAGMRGASAQIVDALPEVGGQLTALYPEKPVYDVPGHPAILAKELVARHRRQTLEQFDVPLHLGTTAERLAWEEDGDVVVVGCDDGTELRSRALIVAAGHGAMEPRTLPELDVSRWEGRGVSHVVPAKEALDGRRVVVVGGGDSACDWALDLVGSAAGPVHLVHRRERFRALEASVERLRSAAADGDVVLHVPARPAEVVGDDRVEAVRLDDGTLLACDELLLQLGFRTSLGALAGWGLTIERGSVRVDPRGATGLPRVWACGDVTAWDGKLKLIATGYGEAATAVAQAVAAIRPGERLQPAYSTDTGVPGVVAGRA